MGVIVGVRVDVGRGVAVGGLVLVGVTITISVDVGFAAVGLTGTFVAVGGRGVLVAVLVGVVVLVRVGVEVGNGVDVAGSGPAGAYKLAWGIISLTMLALSHRSCAIAELRFS